ncbi:hypothetical protein PIB30_081153 [Stylosanthes scabra]|uniref:Secreted protein n=1 Tax=Stylosanthes scabra TaxID=79078 RepID=A0ABU6WPV2_9FABA|nr:hypothetical protein [Stylosanthes scabra]
MPQMMNTSFVSRLSMERPAICCIAWAICIMSSHLSTSSRETRPSNASTTSKTRWMFNPVTQPYSRLETQVEWATANHSVQFSLPRCYHPCWLPFIIGAQRVGALCCNVWVPYRCRVVESILGLHCLLHRCVSHVDGSAMADPWAAADGQFG